MLYMLHMVSPLPNQGPCSPHISHLFGALYRCMMGTSGGKEEAAYQGLHGRGPILALRHCSFPEGMQPLQQLLAVHMHLGLAPH